MIVTGSGHGVAVSVLDYDAGMASIPPRDVLSVAPPRKAIFLHSKPVCSEPALNCGPIYLPENLYTHTMGTERRVRSKTSENGT